MRALQKSIEAGSRSPLHNPASTHGRLATTDLMITFSNLAVTYFVIDHAAETGNECATLS